MPRSDLEPIAQSGSGPQYGDAKALLQAHEKLRGRYRRTGQRYTHAQDLQPTPVVPRLGRREVAEILWENSTGEPRPRPSALISSAQRFACGIHFTVTCLQPPSETRSSSYRRSQYGRSCSVTRG